MSNGNEFVYRAHPSMFRNHPVTYIVLVLLVVVPVLALVIWRDALTGLGDFPPAALLGLTVIGLASLAYWYMTTRAVCLRINGDQVHLEQGLLNKKHTDLRVQQIRSVIVSQNLSDRIFGVGTIEIYTTGDNPEFSVGGMPQPHRVRDHVRNRRETTQ